MAHIAITGVSGNLGRRVLTHLAELGGADHVVGIDRRPLPAGTDRPMSLRTVEQDLLTADLKRVMEGCETIVHLAGVVADTHEGIDRGADANISATRRVLDAASAVGAEQVVLLSSAAVYGAWPDNAVPLTEDAPLRPNPEFHHAMQKAETERFAGEWRDAHPSTRLAILRPAPMLGAPGSRAWLATVTRPGLGDRIAQNVANQQFVHIDDVAAAVVHAAQLGLDGVYNVAPDGWISGDDAPALLGPNLPLPLPERLSTWLTRVARKRGAAAAPRGGRVDGAGPYARYSWVIANDRLKATGWHPRSTSAEALVGSVSPKPLRTFVARHRQEVTLAVFVVLGLVGLGGAAALWRRRRP